MRQYLKASDLFLKAQTDERLAALCREGDTRAFAALIDRHRRVLLGHACRMVGPQRGEDVVQQALLKAWRSLQDGADVRNAEAWLHRIVHNAALTEIERQPRNVEPLDMEIASSASPASAAEQRLELVQVLQGLADLPQRERLALLGTELEGRSRRQLADELGLSEGAVRQLVYRARRRVRAGVAVLVPFPFLVRASRSWARASGAAPHALPLAPAVGGSGILAGGAAKVATVAIAAGALGGGALLNLEHNHHSRISRGRVHLPARGPGSSSHPTAGSEATAGSNLSANSGPTLLAFGAPRLRRTFPAGASSVAANHPERSRQTPNPVIPPSATTPVRTPTTAAPTTPPRQPVTTTSSSPQPRPTTIAISKPPGTTDIAGGGSKDSGSGSQTTTAPSDTTTQADQVDTTTTATTTTATTTTTTTDN